MSTADEVRLMMANHGERMRVAQDAFLKPFTDKMLRILQHGMTGRTVSAKRARFLRRRGDDVKYHSRTATGKARYTWVPRALFTFSESLHGTINAPDVAWFSLTK